MKINGTIFSKPQQDQLKRGIGAELDKVVAKVEDVDKRMLNYTGDWVTDNEYHENDVVTWGTDGHLYEVIKEHTSSDSIKPDNAEYYKAMTATKYASERLLTDNTDFSTNLAALQKAVNKGGFVLAGAPSLKRKYEIMFFSNRYSLVSVNFDTGNGMIIDIIYQDSSISAIHYKYTISTSGAITYSSSAASYSENINIYYLK